MKTEPKSDLAQARGGDQPASGRRTTSDPLYVKIARALKTEIVSGIIPVGSNLPTEDDLSERFAVSRYTIREAIRCLRGDNLVTSRRGAGTVVVADASEAYFFHAMSIADLVAYAEGTRLKIDAINMVALDEGLAARTRLPSNEEWLRVTGIRYREGDEFPVCWTEYYINHKFAAVGRILSRYIGAISPLIESMFGECIMEVEQEIAGALISRQLANPLKVKAGTAALEVRRAYKTADSAIAQLTLSVHPAARFRHSMTVRRSAT